MDSFYVHLSSNVRNLIHKNTTTNFKTELACPIILDEAYEVGLSEMFYTKSWFNIPKNTYIAVRSDEEGTRHPYLIPAGVYQEEEDVIFMLNNYYARLLSDQNLNEFGIKKYIKCSFNSISKKITVSPGEVFTDSSKQKTSIIHPYLEEGLAEYLGFSKVYSRELQCLPEVFYHYDGFIRLTCLEYTKINEETKEIKVEANRTFDLEGGIHSLYVYTDIIKPYHVGDSYSQLLRAIPVLSSKFGRIQHITYQKPHYFPLRFNEIKSIEIDIKDDTGQRIKFEDGRVTIVLHFKRKDERY